MSFLHVRQKYKNTCVLANILEKNRVGNYI